MIFVSAKCEIQQRGKNMANSRVKFVFSVIVYFATFIITSSLSKEKPMYYVGKYGNYTWPRRELAVTIPGDIVLGALHMVHERSEERTCGAIMSQGGIQALETML